MWYSKSSKIKFGVHSKVTPIAIPPTKRDNFVSSKSVAVQNLKLLIFVECLLAINRVYLFPCRKFLKFLAYVYSITLTLFITFFAYQTETLTVAHFVLINTLCTEYFLLVFTCIIANKNKMISFFRNMNTFDYILNISNDINAVDSAYRSILWLSGCLIFHIIEYILLNIYLSFFIDYSVYFIYVMTMAHDCEQIFFFTLLRNIYVRIRVLKAHVSKAFPAHQNTTIYNGKLSNVESMSNKAQLDISSLHRVYDLLHKCSEQLNSLMSLPMILVLTTAALSTIMLMKMTVSSIQMLSTESILAKSTAIYLLARCCKYTALVVVPCYYSSITAQQVSGISTILHDAIHSAPLDKIERRKVKAFFRLTRENEFSYALGGVISLNMSLPLSYMSLCTTYLVISIQFSKFFD